MAHIVPTTQLVNKSGLLRFFIIHERNALHISSSELARRAFLHKSVISEIETGKVNATKNAQQAILKALNCQYMEDDAFFLEQQAQMVLLYEAIANRSFSMIDYIRLNFDTNKEKILHSSAYPYYLQARLCILLHQPERDEEMDRLLSQTGTIARYMEPAFRVRYYDTLLMYLERYGTQDEIREAIKEADSYSYHFHLDTDADTYQFAMLCLHMARACYVALYYDKSMEYIQKAIQYFVSLNSFIRVPTCNLIIANIYHQQGYVEKASRIYLNIIHNISGYVETATINTAGEKYAWCKLLTHNYLEAIHIEEKVEKHHKVTSMNCLIIPYCYWQLKEYDCVNELVEESSMNETLPLEYRHFIQALGYLCKPVTEENHRLFMDSIDEMLTCAIATHDFVIHMFTLYIVTKGCAYFGESKLQAFYLKQSDCNLKKDVFF